MLPATDRKCSKIGHDYVYRGFRPLCHLNWAKVRAKATASEFASYNLCEDADISAQKYTLAYTTPTAGQPATPQASIHQRTLQMRTPSTICSPAIAALTFRPDAARPMVQGNFMCVAAASRTSAFRLSLFSAHPPAQQHLQHRRGTFLSM